MELGLLKLLSNRELYEKLASHIKLSYLTKEAGTIIQAYKAYFDSFTSINDIDFTVFDTWFKLIYKSSYKEEVIKLYSSIFSSISSYTLEEEFEKKLLHSLHLRYYAGKILDISGTIASGGDQDISDIEDIIQEYYTRYPKEDEDAPKIITDDTEDLLNYYNTSGGYNWRLNELNLALGSLRKGDLILIGARPDTGKTTLLASESSFIAPQLSSEHHVVWFNNEEQGYKVRARIIQATLNIKFNDIKSDPISVRDAYYKKIGAKNKIILFDSQAISDKDIYRILEKYKPGLIIFDQLSKINVNSTTGNEAERLNDVAKFARALAKEYAPVLSTIWADASAEGLKYIEMNQLYGSKTGMQGEADAIITIGRVHDPSVRNNTRFLYIPKNKMFGSDEKYRNGRFEVSIDPEKARFTK